MTCEQTLLGFAFENSEGLGTLAFALIMAITFLVLMWIAKE